MDSKDELVAGFRLSGEFVKSLTDKSFEILDAENREVNDLDREGSKKWKCVLSINIDSQTLEWFPNKTSLDYINKKTGYHLRDLIGFKGNLITVNQKVGKDMREVIYVEGSV